MYEPNVCVSQVSLANSQTGELNSGCMANSQVEALPHFNETLESSVQDTVSHLDVISERYHVNPIDPNPAISAHVVFPQSGHIRPKKRPFLKKCPHFSNLEPYKKYGKYGSNISL